MSKDIFKELQADVLRFYEEQPGPLEAERYAAKFLHAQMVISGQLKEADLDARMKKNGRKTMEATILLEEVSKHEKKPSDSILTATVQTNLEVASAQDAEDTAITNMEALKRLYDMLKDAHIFCRTIAKGSYDGQ